MFDLLEADIVVLQELKIQRKDLRDDMVLIPGWDCFFSLPKNKKVAIYTRNATCSPICAEEGVTGILCPPNSTVCYRDLPDSAHIGGYPENQELSISDTDAELLDSEGRCVILEFPAFVLLGVYCPANRDETRDGFRLGYLNALDRRIRNLVSLGKRVVVAGDVNISRDETDSAHALEQIRKGKLTADEFASSPARRIFNQLVDGSRVVQTRDVGREKAVLWDMCRSFHSDRSGILDMKDWIYSANIQEGLMGSDHCPVYAVFKDKVYLNGKQFNFLELLNPSENSEGEKIVQGCSKGLLPLSGRLIPEFNRRRNIREMFLRQSTDPNPSSSQTDRDTISPANKLSEANPPRPKPDPGMQVTSLHHKRYHDLDRSCPKRRRTESAASIVPKTSQKTIRGFFSSKRSPVTQSKYKDCESVVAHDSISTKAGDDSYGFCSKYAPGISHPDDACDLEVSSSTLQNADYYSKVLDPATVTREVNPATNQEPWSKIFKKRAIPRYLSGSVQGHWALTATKKLGHNGGVPPSYGAVSGIRKNDSATK
ncbi:Class II abasic (AP) endonuclease [Emydomyces testavorans]|uniref:Class II abasic (AP) endonuclease n=1 Tax=Emydomyces testavorans TaxID=2070801 RepID=A0AAF0DFX5_9EURO|nr:Class II abasic (AP) endonuclease [Emydomyces testavorans]